MGIGAGRNRTEHEWKSELRRRRLWACYLMHCHMSESLPLFQLTADLKSTELPWPEEHFNALQCPNQKTYLTSQNAHDGVFSNLIQVITIW